MPPQGQQPVRGTVMPPDNEHLVNGLSKTTRDNYNYLKQSAREVAEARPDLDTALYTRYLHDYAAAVAKEEATYKSELRAVKAKKPNMNSIQLRDEEDRIGRGSKERYAQFMDNFNKNVVPQYGVQGEDAWKELHNKMHGPSIIGAATSQIYDKKKGGLQWGGIVGLILGGLMATQLTGGLMTGELLPILATVGTAFLGAWLGNKAADGIGNMMKPDATPAPVRAPERSTEPAPEQEAQRPLSPDARNNTRTVKPDDETEALERLKVAKERFNRIQPAQGTDLQASIPDDVRAQAEAAVRNPPPGTTTPQPPKAPEPGQGRGGSTPGGR